MQIESRLIFRVIINLLNLPIVNDYLDNEGKLRGIEKGSVDIMNFGFETSLEVLKQKE